MLKGNYKKLKVINRVNRKSLKIQISDLIHNSNLGIKVVLVLKSVGLPNIGNIVLKQ